MTTLAGGERIALEGGVFERPPGADGEEPGFRLVAPRFHVRAGQRIALTGPSGSGKTTLLGLLSLALKPGAVTRFTAAPGSGGVHDLAEAWRRMDDKLFDRLRSRFLGCIRHAGEGVAFIGAMDALAARASLAGKRPDRTALRRFLDEVGLAGLEKRTPGRLSQGQRQRLGIACALVHDPDVIIADEPTASLDAANAGRVMALLAGAAERGAAVVIATHDPDLAVRYGFAIAAAEIRDDGAGAMRRTTSFVTAEARG